MSSANCTDELDFRLIFEEDAGRAAGPDHHERTPPSSSQALQAAGQDLYNHLPSLATAGSCQNVTYRNLGPVYEAQGNSRTFDCPSIQITSIAANSHVGPSANLEPLAVGGAEGGYPEVSWSRDQLYLPLDPCYRDPALCPSPCSSLSSRSWMSDLSSCESFSHVYDDVEGELRDATQLPLGSPVGSPGCGGGAFGVELWQQKYQHPLTFSPSLSPHHSPRQSPCHSPRTSVTEETWLGRQPASRPSSRPASPCGKRRHSSADPHARSSSPHHSPTPTPSTSPRGSMADDNWVGSPASTHGTLMMSSNQELDVPSKTRRTSGAQLGLLVGQGDLVLEELRSTITCQDSPREESRQQDGLAELFLQVPSHFSWNKPKPGNPPLFRTSLPPSLDSPLPSQFDQCELKLEVQPRSYHRAHYETEGSRGSIKAAAGGHPVVQLSGYSEQPLGLLLFIGTADERCLRPHSFYQVHRVTGKTVTTSCQEKIMEGTKVLEITLLPENNMSVSVDCAGILKLRNADIELKKGETDIGRKNTRVRVVFRVAVPWADGRMLWLQTATIPVECSQRSGQELPQVDSFSPAGCSVDGGEELLIIGSNMSTQSRVVFMEKGPDGRSLWETEGRVLPEKSSSSSLVVVIPRYGRKTTCPAQVQFYVSNGKRRRSHPQSFSYLLGARRLLPVGAQLVKQEPWGLDHMSHNPPGFHPASHQVSCHDPDQVYVDTCDLPGAPPPSVPLHTTLMFPQTPPILLQTSPSIVPHPPTSIPPGRQQSPSRRALVSPVDPQKSRGEGRSIKQELEEPSLRSLGLQEITLDDVNEIIDRDISSLSSSAPPDQFDQYHQCNWENKSSDSTLPFCGGPQ
ncbi:nuclear factor of activated T-cells, cytoplasmic 3 [Aulostomus maculatus]